MSVNFKFSDKMKKSVFNVDHQVSTKKTIIGNVKKEKTHKLQTQKHIIIKRNNEMKKKKKQMGENKTNDNYHEVIIQKEVVVEKIIESEPTLEIIETIITPIEEKLTRQIDVIGIVFDEQPEDSEVDQKQINNIKLLESHVNGRDMIIKNNEILIKTQEANIKVLRDAQHSLRFQNVHLRRAVDFGLLKLSMIKSKCKCNIFNMIKDSVLHEKINQMITLENEQIDYG